MSQKHHDDDSKKSGESSTLGSMVLLGLGAAAGWFLASWADSKKKEASPMFATPKPCNFQDTCAICLERFNQDEKNIILDCTHTFHKNCFVQNSTAKCPICRAPYIPFKT